MTTNRTQQAKKQDKEPRKEGTDTKNTTTTVRTSKRDWTEDAQKNDWSGEKRRA